MLLLNTFREVNGKKLQKIFDEAQKTVQNSKQAVDAWAGKYDFSTREWLVMWSLTYSTEQRQLRSTALRKAIECAQTAKDWISIANHAPYRTRKRAYNEIAKFEPTAEIIDLMKASKRIKLRTIGWYLSKRSNSA